MKLKGEIRDDFLLASRRRGDRAGSQYGNEYKPFGTLFTEFKDKDRSKIIQNHVDETRKAGGVVILNHPNYGRRLQTHPSTEILPVKNLYMFELYNAHPGVHSFGNAHRPNLEQVWDALLEKKMTIYGVSSDDAT